MTGLAFTLAATNALTVLAFLAYVRNLVRPYQRREDAWADRLMHLTDRTWTPPPERPEPAAEPEFAYSHAPEQDESF